jgi:N-acetylmuramoyl-L-alanine amidase
MSAFNEGAALVFTERDGGRVGILKRPSNYDEDRGGALIRVFLNDERLDFKDADPLIENGRTLVPMRGILETLGAQVDWNEQTRTVTAVKDGITISLAVGNTAAAVNGEPRNLDVPARIINNRTMVPLRFLAESLSAAVDWDETRRVIRITA